MSCYHCSQPVKDELVEKDIQGVKQRFCCHGCASVCEIIHESGLDSFYKLSPQTQRPAATNFAQEISEFYDYDEVQSQFVTDLGNERSITLMSDSIHCAACIWLIEHALAKLDGIKHANVNFTNKQIKLRWDNRQITLSEILKALNQIGYEARPYDAAESEAAYKKANRDLLFRLGFSGFILANTMTFSVALYTGAQQDSGYSSYFYLILFILATLTLLYPAMPFLKGAWKNLKAKTVGMDTSISLGLLITYAYSSYVVFIDPSMGRPFFATIVDLVFMLLIGRYLEALSKNRALDSTRRLMDLQPKMARKLIDGKEEIVPVATLQLGDVVLVKPGDKFPVDGLIVQGSGQVNESMLTGESREIYKEAGMQVAAGTINLDGSLEIQVNATLAETRLGKIIQAVEDAQGSKSTIQCTAEKIMPYFISIVLTLAAGSFAFWLWQDSIEVAITTATAVLIITCPCALGLATPMAMAVAAGVAARNGILVKNGVVLEMLNDIDHFVFDKTGTLTTGKMSLVEQKWVLDPPTCSSTCDENLIKLSKLEARSEHSLARALVNFVDEKHPSWRTTEGELVNFKANPGAGVEGEVSGELIKAGTARWLGQSLKLPQDLLDFESEQAELGRTSIWVALDNKIAGVLFFEDTIRPDAKETLERLKARGKSVTLLSGDKVQVAQAVASQLGGMEVIAEVLPEQKSAKIAELQQQGLKVAMVGDGINDAPALSRAHIGYALGGGTDISMDSSDLVLLNDELLAIDTSLDLSTRTLKTVRENIGLSIGYNIIMVPLAMAAFLTPLIASITMPLSGLVVILNAMRIRRFYK